MAGTRRSLDQMCDILSVMDGPEMKSYHKAMKFEKDSRSWYEDNVKDINSLRKRLATAITKRTKALEKNKTEHQVVIAMDRKFAARTFRNRRRLLARRAFDDIIALGKARLETQKAVPIQK